MSVPPVSVPVAPASPATPPRGLARIDAVLTAVEEGARSTSQVATATGLHRTTVHRLIKDLEARGYLAFVGSLGYMLGPRLLRMANTAMRDIPIRMLAEPILERLAATTGESAQLYVLSGDRRICVAAVQSDSELRTIVEVGASLPLTAGSAGKLFLAWLPEPVRESLIATAIDPDALRQQVTRARKRGWAQSIGEREVGVGSVSAPVRGRLDTLLAVVSVSGPVTRLGPGAAKRYSAAVTSAAADIERAMGTTAPA